ncbi:hypothetical protein TUM19381_22560 [Staphylococcus aureus]|nr:hypothetical protein TPS5614TP_22360 [Staphylococcus aureus]BDB38806.1 hypothetical protein TPS6281TP_21830 [Staphylococcus aureus]BEU07910.1 hypothetical protein TUM19381_22560 [Staphylococcus aureus]BEU10600.1 hypothetical protein TUM19957_22660 [Staphylococcus aureus]BEU13220.1 hypothetical protein TUM19959_21960 [Staphylococcus aureus]
MTHAIIVNTKDNIEKANMDKIPINVMMKPIMIMKSISVAIRKTPIKVITTKTIDQII